MPVGLARVLNRKLQGSISAGGHRSRLTGMRALITIQLPPATHRTTLTALIKIGELELNVRARGHGETVFLVRGRGASSHLRVNQIRVLAAHYWVIAIDLRGFGRSSKPHARTAYSIDLMADDVIAVCRDLDLREIHFLGVSMGGFIGQAVALKAPQLCRSLILGQTAAEFCIPAEVLAARLAALDKDVDG